MNIEEKLELTRNDFEKYILKNIRTKGIHVFHNLDRNGFGYSQASLDSEWSGWCEAIKTHAVLLQPVFDEAVKPACEKCGYKKIMDISSTQERMCHKCHHVTPWLLKDNQAPFISSSRDKRKSKI